MNLYDKFRASIDYGKEDIGERRSAVIVGATFALALLDQMDSEEGNIKAGKPRTADQILIDSLENSKDNRALYEKQFHQAFDLLDEDVVRRGVKTYNSFLKWRDHNWLLPIFQGVITNFLWLIICMLLVWVAFAIKEDWPAIVQSWFV